MPPASSKKIRPSTLNQKGIEMTELPMIIGPCPHCGFQITYRQVKVTTQQKGITRGKIVYPYGQVEKVATLTCHYCGWSNSLDVSGPIVPSLQSALNPVGRESDPPDRPNGCLVGPAILLAVGLWFLL